MRKEENPLADLFQKEFSKMIAVISKLFGLQHIEIAEDIVSETFILATETWEIKGIPESPAGWLYAVAKQKTLSHLRRNKIFTDKIIPQLKITQDVSTEIAEVDFSHQNIKDSQLQMMFAICNPAIASEAQIGLALRILCGFGIDEIAEAFLTNKETINKRLFRAKEKLRAENIQLELPSEKKISSRLDNVLHIIYLLFSEGYFSTTQNQTLRKDFCYEALHLGILLTEFSQTNQPKTNALIALMCFHASRLDSRESDDHAYILYDNQDEQLWNQDFINQGNYYLNASAQGNDISSYHLEAGIAFWHCQKEDTKEKWEKILFHYDLLLEKNYSPSVALNRIYAIYKAKGKTAALVEAEKFTLVKNHYYYTLLGELRTYINDKKAIASYQTALSLAKTQTDKRTILNKIEHLLQH